MFLCSREKPEMWSLSFSGSCLVGMWLWDWRLVAAHQRMKLTLCVAEQDERICVLGHIESQNHHFEALPSSLSSSIHTT